ncbi:MAG TPA: CHAT domain-containing protein [Rubrivivax sp.]
MAEQQHAYLFRVPGTAESTARGTRVAVSATRDAAVQHTLRAVDGEHIVALTIANGPTLYLHPANAQRLLQAQQADGPRSGRAGAATDGAVEVGAMLSFTGPAGDTAPATRGLIGRVVLQAVELISGPLREKAAGLTAQLAARKLESATSPGVHAMPRPRSGAAAVDGLPSFALHAPLAAIPPSSEPMLVFIHGTFSSLAGTFGKLWKQHPALVERLFDFYRGGVWGLDHHSVTNTPFANARLLMDVLPANARVHLVTHSRGGLVGEALVRASREGGGAAFDATDMALLKGPGYASHRADLVALNTAFATRTPRFERMVRVASPARGTLLASGRVDAYLSALQWGMSLAGIPVLPELLDFAAEVARERSDPAVFPGLESMIPGTAVSQVLTRPDLRLASELRVVAGDVQGDSVLSWLKVLLTDAFYLTEHDLVVNTNSMYGGTPRSERPTFVYERGAQVSHFAYFGNASSAQAIVDGLTLAAPAQYRPVGPLSWDGRSSEGVRAVRPMVANTGQRPAVFVLPGIMGSHLMVDGKRVWASPKALFFGGLEKLKYPDAKVKAEEPMDNFFGDLMEDLSDAYDVIPFAYDWRLPIEDSARVLAAAIDAALAARAGKNLPVRLLAHSMGGLVIRTVELVEPGVWNRLMAQDGARIVLAGTPNRGAFAPMLALSAMHPLVNTVEAIDTCTSWNELKRVLGNFPGLLQLQALQSSEGLDLTQRASWQQLADWHLAQPAAPVGWHDGTVVDTRRPWGVPQQSALDSLRTLREALDARLPHYQRHGKGLVLVAGHADQTIVDVKKGVLGIDYVASSAGDGTVPWASLRLPGVACWRAEAEHGDLLRERKAFRAYRELLDDGQTGALPMLAEGATRAGAAPAADTSLRPWVPVRSPYPPTLGEVQAAALGSGLQPPLRSAAADDGDGLPLEVEVVHGNLKHVQEPLLVGHYIAPVLTGTEKFLDKWIGGAMRRSLNLGLYPAQLREQQVFVNQRGTGDNPFSTARPRPEAVIVAGLGEEESLTPQGLVETVCKAVLAYSQHCAQAGGAVPPTLRLASVLLASGGWRIDVPQAAGAIVRGVCEANERLVGEKLPVVSHLTLVELYGDRASIAHTALADVQTQRQAPIRLAPTVLAVDGGRTRPVERGYRGTTYDLIHVTSAGTAKDEFQFVLHTGRARSEVRAMSTQRRLVDRLVHAAESELRYDADLARTLLQMLVPVEIRPMIAGADSLFVSLDPESARIPWEMLHDSAIGIEPLALRIRVVRTLRLAALRDNPVDNRNERGVLVIGEPLADPAKYARLPGAEKEARAVAGLFEPEWEVDAVMHADARKVLQALNRRNWRIVHVAGHGDYQADADGRGYGGVVLDGGTFLGAKEIEALGTVPELVFVNCCHLGKVGDGAAAMGGLRERSRFAASIAEQLMRIGVRCVVAAGWAVEDAAATAFASAFYTAVLRGRDFSDAVLRARRAAYALDPGGNTWAAYQCYGDPSWRLRGLPGETEPPRPDAGAPPAPATPTRADLHAALTEVQWEAKDRLLDPDGRALLAARMQVYEQRCAEVWGHQGAVAQAFGLAWAEVGDLRLAVAWLERAVKASDGGATMYAREQLANLRVRQAVRDEGHGRGGAGPAAVKASMKELQWLIELQPTVERLSLRGSAHKRLALLAARRGEARRAALAGHIGDMSAGYLQAVELAPAEPGSSHSYPRMQRACGLLLGHLLAGRDPREPALEAALLDAHATLADADLQQPDFWSAVGQPEWELYRSLALHHLHAPYSDIAARFAAIHEREPDVRRWASVRDTIELVERVARLAPGLPVSQADAAAGLLAQVRAYASELL